MRKIKDVLRLKFDAKLSHQQIAAALGISKGVVTKYVGLAAAAGLDWSTIRDVDETVLEHQLIVMPERVRDHAQPDYARLHQELVFGDLPVSGLPEGALQEEFPASFAVFPQS